MYVCVCGCAEEYIGETGEGDTRVNICQITQANEPTISNYFHFYIYYRSNQ